MYRVFSVSIGSSTKSHGTQNQYPNLGDPFVPFSTFTITLLDYHRTSFIEMADVLGCANITEETLIVSRRL
jgi:hypothetical protein